MALWWIKGVQRESDEAIEYLLEADSEALAKMKADRHGINVKMVKPYQGTTEMQAVQAELVEIRKELGALRKGVVRRRNRLRDKPVWTIAIGVFLGVTASAVLICGIWLAAQILLTTEIIHSYQ